MKDEEIYTIFDTKKIAEHARHSADQQNLRPCGRRLLDQPDLRVWTDGEKLDKKSPLVIAMKEWVDQQYEDGRQTVTVRTRS